MSHPPSLFRTFATVGSYTMLSRVAGFLRETLMATFIGAGAASDAFFVAFTIPNLFRSLFAEGAFSAGFVPIFAQTLERDGQEKAKQFADEAFAVLTVVLLIFSAVMMIAMPLVLYVMAPGFEHIPGQMERTTALARIAFPYLLFVSLTSLQSGVLNALGRFAVPAAAPVLLNITLITALLLGVGADGDRALFMSWGVFVAGVVQFVWLAADCRRVGVGFHLVRPHLTPEVKQLIARIVPVAYGAGIYQVNVVVNRIVASLVGVGAVSWINYADRVNQLPIGIFGTAIGVALLPLLARQIQSGQEAAALANQNRAIEISLLLTMPAAVGIAVLAEPITAVVFEHGRFTPGDRHAVASALLAFSFGLPAYVLNKALTPGFFGRHDTRTPVIASTVALVVNLTINIALMHKFGHVGIAIGTSVSAWLNAGLLSTILYRRGHLKPDDRLRRRLPRIVITSAAMGVGLWWGLGAVLRVFGPVFGMPGLGAGANGSRTLALILLIGGGGLIYLLSAFAVGAATRDDLGLLKRRRKGPIA
ncbi:MAG: murein biosynthesis integral membrane protein MurJ [Rhodospirillaceae bacterium]|nr:MAG: murein biosynthesis integral membrane protein MurJ [Rhodospirillaceae bacterium]